MVWGQEMPKMEHYLSAGGIATVTVSSRWSRISSRYQEFSACLFFSTAYCSQHLSILSASHISHWYMLSSMVDESAGFSCSFQ